jgi:predicted RNA-binding Zn ribbon-like protein
MVRREHSWPGLANVWLARFPPLPQVGPSPPAGALHHVAAPASGAVGQLLAIVVDAVAADTWSRLKICPDCQWAFYDHTRSRTKIWCDMLAGDAGGRSCGTIAKVRRFRERQAEPGN